MAEAGASFDPDAYVGAVKGYYTTTDGKMLSMPFNSSTPILYYNKEAFQKAGLDPSKPPKTWPEVADAAKQIVAAGYPCGFSTAWISWVHLENFSAWHNVPFGTKENGFAGIDTEFEFNSPLHVKHIQSLADCRRRRSSSTADDAISAIPSSPRGSAACTRNPPPGTRDSRRAPSSSSA